MLGTLQLPDIMECSHFILASSGPRSRDLVRQVMDYELDFHLAGGRIMYLDGAAYHVPSNSITCRRPGQHVSGEGAYDMYMLTLDYTHRLPKLAQPRHSAHEMQPLVDSYFWDLLPPCFEPAHAAEIQSLYRRLCLKHDSGLLAELMHLLAADLFSRTNSTREKPTAVEQTLQYLNEHWAQRITLEDLANHAHQSKSYLVRCFHRETGLTPIACLTDIRLTRAQAMIRCTDDAISSIAFQCGFSDPSYFSLCFRQRFGVSPTVYRQTSAPSR